MPLIPHISHYVPYMLQVIGAASAGWTPLRFNEWFDNDFPDWLEIDSKEDALAGKGYGRDRELWRKRRRRRMRKRGS